MTGRPVLLQNPFQEAGELNKVQQTLATVPRAAQYVLATGLTAAAAVLGFLFGSRSPGMSPAAS